MTKRNSPLGQQFSVQFFRGMAILSLTILAVPVYAQSSMVQQAQWQPGYRSGTLPNGFRYVIVPSMGDKKDVAITFQVKLGSADMEPRLLQAPHVIEHLLMARTLDMPNSFRLSLTEQVRIALGATSAGASTGSDSTNYNFEAPVSKLSGVLEFLRKLAYGRQLKAEDIRTDSRIAISEMMLKADDRSLLNISYRNFGSPSLANDTAAARAVSLRTMDAGAIRSIYEEWYRADSQTIYVVGDVDATSVERHINRLFSDIPAGAPKQAKRLPMRDASKGLIAYAAGLNASTSTLLLDYRRQAGELATSKQKATRVILAQLLAEELDARRSQLLNPLLMTAVTSDERQWREVPSGLDVQFSAPKGSFTAAAKELYAVMHRIAQGTFDVSGFATIKANSTSSAPRPSARSCDTASEIMSVFQRGTSQGSPEKLDCGSELAQSDFADVTPADVAHEMRRLLIEPRMGFLSVVPVGDNEVSFDQLRRVGRQSADVARTVAEPKHAEPVSLAPFVLNEAGGPLALTPQGNDLYRVANANGRKIFIRRSAGGNVWLQAFGTGLESLPTGKRADASVAAELVKRNGINGLRGADLDHYLKEAGIHYDVRLGSTESMVEVLGPGKDMPIMMTILDGLLRGSEIEPTIRRDFSMRYKAASPSDSEIMETILGAALRANVPPPKNWPSNADRPIPGDDEIEQIWKGLFGDPSQLILVGTAPSDIGALGRAYLALANSLPVTPQGTSNVEPRLWDGAQRKYVLSRGYGDAAQVGLTIPLPVPQERAGTIAAGLSAAIGQRTRLYHRLREIEAGAYSPRISVFSDPIDSTRVLIDIRFACDPAETGRLVEGVWDEIANIQTTGFSSDEVGRINKIEPIAEPLTASSIARKARRSDNSNIEIALAPEPRASADEILAVIRRVQRDQLFVVEARP